MSCLNIYIPRCTQGVPVKVLNIYIPRCTQSVPVQVLNIYITRCTQGVPVQVLKNKHSVGRQLTPLSAAGR